MCEAWPIAADCGNRFPTDRAVWQTPISRTGTRHRIEMTEVLSDSSLRDLPVVLKNRPNELRFVRREFGESP